MKMLSVKLPISSGRIPVAPPAKTSKSGPWRLNSCLTATKILAANQLLKRLLAAAKKLLLPAQNPKHLLLKKAANNLVKKDCLFDKKTF